ncbi:MAG: hypothetical protein ACPG7F_07145 [Aggregatilineales bacterium]
MSENKVTLWKVLSTVGKGVAKSVQMVGEGANATATAVEGGKIAARNSMPVTEVTSVFNTTDHTISFLNRETARDAKEVLGQSAVSLRSENTGGAWIPWYDPPRFSDFARRRMEIIVDGVSVLYMWQRGDFIYWSNRLDSEGRPAKAYKMAGIQHVGGKRTLVVRHDPELGYSAFLSNVVNEPK